MSVLDPSLDPNALLRDETKRDFRHETRRVAAWGALRANWIYLKVGARWGLGLRKGLKRHYPDVR